MFIDYTEIEIHAGNGGKGAIAFRREKYVPKGGPSGGNGGKGGDVIIRAHHNLSTLLDLKHKKVFKAGNGEPGGTSLKDGKNGKNILIKVPIGTIVRDFETKKIICDLDKDLREYLIASGGKGGRGNSNFATPTNQAPRIAEPGMPGDKKKIIFELKLIADVGLVGFPNAGKSTLISKISAARPKIADYPFTTLEPNLGIVRYKEFNSFTVADIPGIIEGAHLGKGLGHKFLRHIERTKIILFLIEITSDDYIQDYNILLSELRNYSQTLADKTKILALSKADLVDETKLKKLSSKKIKNLDHHVIIFSSITGTGMESLLDTLWKALQKEKG
jgi:GTP-binding protein